jgi:hypothetical protein
MVVGLCVAIVAIVGLSFALYYYVSIAPRLSKINDNDLLANPLVGGGTSTEMNSGPLKTSGVSENNSMVGKSAISDYNEL